MSATKSQQAFEKHYMGYYDLPPEMVDFSKTDGLYNMSYLHRDFEKWQAAEVLARKQALEDAIAICNATCDPFNTEHGNGYNRAALDCEKKIKELLK